jgi:hypothetical protein
MGYFWGTVAAPGTSREGKLARKRFFPEQEEQLAQAFVASEGDMGAQEFPFC